jgi:hypothetical protein
MTEVDQRITLAREYLAGAQQRDVLHLPPSALLRECAESRRQLGQVLDAATGQASTLAGIRAVLAAFDWESGDRQIALERIERIVDES